MTLFLLICNWDFENLQTISPYIKGSNLEEEVMIKLEDDLCMTVQWFSGNRLIVSLESSSLR